MDFGFSPEQQQLREQVRRFLDDESPLERVRTLMAADAPFDAALWKKIADLGWQALVVPAANDGLGLSWEDVVVVAEETGRSLFPSPFISTAVAARLIAKLGDDAQNARWLAPIAAGLSVAVLAVSEENDLPFEAGVETTARSEGGRIILQGTKMFIADGMAADLLLVVAREGEGLSVFAVPADSLGLTRKALKLVDTTQRAARIELAGVTLDASCRLGRPGEAAAAVRDALDAEIVARAAEMVGSADAALKLAVEYAKVRKQFGQPIGRFQGVKHELAEVHVEIESARSLTYYASWAVDNSTQAARHVSMAKIYASAAADRAGEACVQTHGAIGFTWECDAHLFYKRGRMSRVILGSAGWHGERVLAADGL
jgi:alkylation response protein AidB-like acyl-CoA dehydrogenase